ncbi:MAG TPA: chromate efflux transporter [Lacunisphaera sp.]|jgi:chromate transporter|nr:chromate efflux transporter [Lacunisphaera sp.]
MPPRPSLAQLFLVALRLGCISFGGPVAHLGYYRKEYVERRRWIDDAHFADLVALCQFLPGPSSSQTGFAIGCQLRGLAGGLAVWLGFTLPSAILMTAFALGLASSGHFEAAGWMRGLKVAAVAVVGSAVWTMGRSLCPDWSRRVLALAAAALVFWVPRAWTQIAVIGAGALVGLSLRGNVGAESDGAPGAKRRVVAGDGRPEGGPGPDPTGVREITRGAQPDCAPTKGTGMACLLLFGGLLLGLPAVVRITNFPALDAFDRFYRVGALVFGGGHVVLPLLEHEVVAPGWLTHDRFLAGYGAAQALPGPLFTLSAYLGASIAPGGWSGAAVALVAIFLPGLLLTAGVLPFWHEVRAQAGPQAALRGANAAVVGVLLAAFYDPVCTAALTSGRATGLAVAALLALGSGRVPVWAVVFGSALAGAWLL